jgi:hypothetical protein
MVERIYAYGHRNVTGRHRTTLEVTKDEEISKKADCIIGVGADKGLKDLGEDFKSKAKSHDATIEVILVTGDIEEKIIGKGHPDLTFTHGTDVVVRKSEFICERTLMIKADKSSMELQRRLIERLKDPKQRIEVLIDLK